MKESVGYTVTLNIVITFVIIVFAFLCAAIIYYKSYKASNIVVSELEKYEGFNESSSTEISMKLSSIGYDSINIKSCPSTISDSAAVGPCELQLLNKDDTTSTKGTCIYLCTDNTDKKDEEGMYFYYKVRTNMVINIPIINDLINLPIYSNTNRMYDYNKKFSEKTE